MSKTIYIYPEVLQNSLYNVNNIVMCVLRLLATMFKYMYIYIYIYIYVINYMVL